MSLKFAKSQRLKGVIILCDFLTLQLCDLEFLQT